MFQYREDETNLRWISRNFQREVWTFRGFWLTVFHCSVLSQSELIIFSVYFSIHVWVMKSTTLITTWKELLLIGVCFILYVEQGTIRSLGVGHPGSFLPGSDTPILSCCFVWGHTCKMAQHFCLSNIDFTCSNYWLISIGQILQHVLCINY